MNIETLLEAAKYVEQHEEQNDSATRAGFVMKPPSPTSIENKIGAGINVVILRSPPLDKNLYPSPYVSSFGRADDAPNFRKKQYPGTRKANKSEKSRKGNFKVRSDVTNKQLSVDNVQTNADFVTDQTVSKSDDINGAVTNIVIRRSPSLEKGAVHSDLESSYGKEKEFQERPRRFSAGAAELYKFENNCKEGPEYNEARTDFVIKLSPSSSNLEKPETKSLDTLPYHSIFESPLGSEDEVQDLRKKLSIDTREVHNKLEKNRRAHLKECFDLVKKQLPSFGDEEKKVSNLNILHNAIKYIQMLRKKDREFEHEIERLARDKIALQQKFANLKKESAADYHLDFNTLIPDSIISDQDELTKEEKDHDSQQPTQPFSTSMALSPIPMPLPLADVKSFPRNRIAQKQVPSDMPKMFSFTSRLETKQHIKTPTHLLPNISSGHLSTIVSPTIQLVSSSNLRMLPGDPPTTFSFSQTNVPNRTMPKTINIVTTKGGLANEKKNMTLLQKTIDEDLVHTNGIRAKSQILTIPSSAFQSGVAKSGVIYKQAPTQGLPSGLTHVVSPLPGPHGTILTPVTVVSQGSHLAQILTASGKMSVVMHKSNLPVLLPYRSHQTTD